MPLGGALVELKASYLEERLTEKCMGQDVSYLKYGPGCEVDEILSVDVSDYRSSVQCGGTSVGSIPRRWKKYADAKPILFCHRQFSWCVSIGELEINVVAWMPILNSL
ncbi:hypothetical protein HN51_054208 [Arachis hypogaea]